MITDTKNFREKLEAEKKILIEELSSLGRFDEKTNDWQAVPIIEETTVHEADENDLADHDEDFQTRSSTLNSLETRLNEVDSAMQKIDEGKYGLCETCSKEIEADRLEANPAAKNCKDHME